LLELYTVKIEVLHYGKWNPWYSAAVYFVLLQFLYFVLKYIQDSREVSEKRNKLAKFLWETESEKLCIKLYLKQNVGRRSKNTLYFLVCSKKLWRNTLKVTGKLVNKEMVKGCEKRKIKGNKV
jgi:hypothetical protein